MRCGIDEPLLLSEQSLTASEAKLVNMAKCQLTGARRAQLGDGVVVRQRAAPLSHADDVAAGDVVAKHRFARVFAVQLPRGVGHGVDEARRLLQDETRRNRDSDGLRRGCGIVVVVGRRWTGMALHAAVDGEIVAATTATAVRRCPGCC